MWVMPAPPFLTGCLPVITAGHLSCASKIRTNRAVRLSYQVNLLNDLTWLGLDWDEGPQKDGAYGPYKQSERLDIYAAHLQKLMAADLVYPCYCTEEELDEERQALILSKRMPRYMGKCRNLTAAQRKEKEAAGRKPSFRFKVPDETIEFTDLIRGAIKFEGTAIGDFIIVRSNGMPAYNFAVVIDDHLMGITHVIRGEDHLSNTALQIMLYRAFGFTPPTFAHHCLDSGQGPCQTQQTPWFRVRR